MRRLTAKAQNIFQLKAGATGAGAGAGEGAGLGQLQMCWDEVSGEAPKGDSN